MLTTYLLRYTPTLFEWAMILLPLTIYLIWLGFEVGRKKHPYVLNGVWDTLLLVMALSGILCLGPPTWLISRFAIQGWGAYAVAYAIYLLVVSLLSLWWIRSGRRSLVIYNIDPGAFQATFQPILDTSGMKFQMTPGHVSFEGQKLLIDLEPTPSLFCVTLSWAGDAQLWNRIEESLRSALSDLQTTRNPAGALIPLYAAVLLSFIAASTVLFVWYLAFIF